MMITDVLPKIMRTIVDIPDVQIKFLDNISKKKKLSRAEIIRQALSSYIAGYRDSQKGYKLAFGIWKDKDVDSVSYQKKLRNEWDR